MTTNTDQPNTFSPDTAEISLARRRLCQSVISGTVMVGAGLLPAIGSPATAGTLDLTDNADLLQAMIKMRGSLDSELQIGWVRAKRFAVSNGRVEPLCGFVAATFNRFSQKSANLFEVVTLEITHYTDFETGEVLDQLTMPFTNKVVAVPRYRFGPVKARFAVRLDEKEDFKPAADTTEEAFAPAGSVLMTKSIRHEETRSGRLFLRHEEHGRVQPENTTIPSMFYKESTIWSAPVLEVLDTSVRNVDASVGYAAMTSWRPWMNMGDLPGNTMSNGYGGKAASLADLPVDFLQYTRQRQPDVLEDPAAILDAIDE
jgi:hypothetical protein